MQTNEIKKTKREIYTAPEAVVEDLRIELAFLQEDDGSAGGFKDDEW